MCINLFEWQQREPHMAQHLLYLLHSGVAFLCPLELQSNQAVSSDRMALLFGEHT